LVYDGTMFPLMLTALALGQPAPETPQIRVTGRATLSVQPEQAEVDVGVVTEAAEAEEAARQNATKLDAALNALRAALGPSARFETVSYSLQPVYRRPEPGEEPRVRGYTATNIVGVRELELGAVGKVIDIAASSGGNSIRNIRFSLKDEESVKSRALRQAAVDAKAKTETLAEALGVKVVRILSATEGEPDVIRPMPMYRGEMAMAQAAAPPTPVEPGTIEIHASVTLVVEISK
jgi:uncharacterized protein